MKAEERSFITYRLTDKYDLMLDLYLKNRNVRAGYFAGTLHEYEEDKYLSTADLMHLFKSRISHRFPDRIVMCYDNCVSIEIFEYENHIYIVREVADILEELAANYYAFLQWSENYINDFELDS